MAREKELTREEIENSIYEIIQNSPGIDSYGVLFQLTKKHENFHFSGMFHEYLSTVIRTRNIRVTKSKYYPRKVVLVPVQVEMGLPKSTCYNCFCMKKIKDCLVHGYYPDDDRYEYFCTIDPKLQFNPEMGSVPFNCPINKAYNVNGGKDNDD